MNDGYAKYKAEEQRQATALAKAMKNAADECAKTFDSVPMLNAFAGALVGLEIELLLSIEDGRARKNLLNSMDQALDKGIIDGLRNPNRTFAKTAILGGKDA
jgi:hypothetical protein